jgi:hypothetical protein
MNTKKVLNIVAVASLLFAGTCYASTNEPAANTEREAAQEQDVNPRDAASGMATGKRQHRPVAASGQPKPRQLDKASPKLMEHSGNAPARAGYRLCPDGTMINPGEKCPEKKR